MNNVSFETPNRHPFSYFTVSVLCHARINHRFHDQADVGTPTTRQMDGGKIFTKVSPNEKNIFRILLKGS